MSDLQSTPSKSENVFHSEWAEQRAKEDVRKAWVNNAWSFAAGAMSTALVVAFYSLIFGTHQ